MKKGKKPGEFLKTKIRNKNIHKNFELLRQLQNEEISEAEILVQTESGYKKVIVEKIKAKCLADIAEPPLGSRIIYLADKGRGRKIRMGTAIDKDGYTVYSDTGHLLRLFDGILAVVKNDAP